MNQYFNWLTALPIINLISKATEFLIYTPHTQQPCATQNQWKHFICIQFFCKFMLITHIRWFTLSTEYTSDSKKPSKRNCAVWKGQGGARLRATGSSQICLKSSQNWGFFNSLYLSSHLQPGTSKSSQCTEDPDLHPGLQRGQVYMRRCATPSWIRLCVCAYVSWDRKDFWQQWGRSRVSALGFFYYPTKAPVTPLRRRARLGWRLRTCRLDNAAAHGGRDRPNKETSHFSAVCNWQTDVSDLHRSLN